MNDNVGAASCASANLSSWQGMWQLCTASRVRVDHEVWQTSAVLVHVEKCDVTIST